MTDTDATTAPVAVGLIGAGAIGAFHGETLARRLPGARLAGVADPAPGAAERLAGSLGAPKATTDPAELLADPAVEAVLIAAPARFHADLVVAAAGAGKAVLCEKPMARTLADADRAIAAAQAAGVALQVGFNRRFDRSFRAAHDLVAAGRLGTPQLLRSLTRDPGIPDPGRVPPSTIFLETLIHDFDTLRYLNPGAEAVEVYAVADALAYPDFRDQGLQDTTVVLVRFDNGAMATAEASFNAVYGYDIRARCSARPAWPPPATSAAPPWPTTAPRAWSPTPGDVTSICSMTPTPPSWPPLSTASAAAPPPSPTARTPAPPWPSPWPPSARWRPAARCDSARSSSGDLTGALDRGSYLVRRGAGRHPTPPGGASPDDPDWRPH
jgi:myo-inositol 2-dehydrogenase/D-chiro-inositol 1-dehydrogenase